MQFNSADNKLLPRTISVSAAVLDNHLVNLSLLSVTRMSEIAINISLCATTVFNDYNLCYLLRKVSHTEQALKNVIENKLRPIKSLFIIKIFL